MKWLKSSFGGVFFCTRAIFLCSLPSGPVLPVSTYSYLLQTTSPSSEVSSGRSLISSTPQRRHALRHVRSGGGVGLYLSDNLDYRIRTDIYADEDEVMESLFIEIIGPHERNVIVGLTYRPLNQNVNDFVTRMNDVLEKISRDNKTCYLMGDFNLNVLNNENHNATGEFLDGLYSHLFFPLITLPSRITSHTASLIDNSFSSHVENSHLRSGLLITDISDHLPIFSPLIIFVLINAENVYSFVTNASKISLIAWTK